jgi:DNA-binding PadR family transcriptional regulator
MRNDSILGFALLGLLFQQAMSGYDLRKLFASTAMGSFSDSPGAIYPALARLEKQGKIRGAVEESAGLRQKKIYKLTAKGLGALKAWLKQPVTRDDVIRHIDELMLRFAFVDPVLGHEQAARFLREMEREIGAYLPEVEQFLKANEGGIPLSGKLALECGVRGYRMHLEWAGSSAAQYERREENQK